MENCFANFLQNNGLYDSIEITQDNFNEFCDLIGGEVRISEYCTKCKVKRVFTMEPIKFVAPSKQKEDITLLNLRDVLVHYQSIQTILSDPRIKQPIVNDEWDWNLPETKAETRIIIFPFVCAMDDDHHLDYIVKTEGNKMIKIGQYPSVADLSFPDFNEFKKEIDKDSLNELRRANGLYAHGIGVGSYVYLRRIFEHIIDITRQDAQNDESIDFSGFESLKVADRIQLLKDYLPDMITSNQSLYRITSKGIHELNEKECIRYFPVLRDAILMILQQWSEKRKQDEVKKELERQLSNIETNLSSK